MPIFSRGSNHTVFLHIPKTGGTSLESFARKAGYEVALLDVPRLWSKSNALKCPPQHFHYEIVDKLVNWGLITRAFTVVRNPVSRLVSEYFYQLTRLRIQPERLDLEAWVLWALDQYAEDPFALNNHLRPQVDFLGPGVRTLRFEDGLQSVGDEMFPLAKKRIPMRRRRTPPGFTHRFSRALRRKISSVYGRDFNELGYQWPES